MLGAVDAMIFHERFPSGSGLQTGSLCRIAIVDGLINDVRPVPLPPSLGIEKCVGTDESDVVRSWHDTLNDHPHGVHNLTTSIRQRVERRGRCLVKIGSKAQPHAGTFGFSPGHDTAFGTR
jgi:hypothetical protein